MFGPKAGHPTLKHWFQKAEPSRCPCEHKVLLKVLLDLKRISCKHVYSRDPAILKSALITLLLQCVSSYRMIHYSRDLYQSRGTSNAHVLMPDPPNQLSFIQRRWLCSVTSSAQRWNNNASILPSMNMSVSLTDMHLLKTGKTRCSSVSASSSYSVLTQKCSVVFGYIRFESLNWLWSICKLNDEFIFLSFLLRPISDCGTWNQ